MVDYEEIIMAFKNGNVPSEGVKSLCFGRDLELKEFEYLLDQTKKGKSFARFLNGDFGAGKSFF